MVQDVKANHKSNYLLYQTLTKQIKCLQHQISLHDNEIQFNLKNVTAYENKIKRLYDENERTKDIVSALYKDIEHLELCLRQMNMKVDANGNA